MNEEEIREIMKSKEELYKKIYVIDEHIVINVVSEYNIPLTGCSTPQGILHWVHHLTEKTWMTTELMRRFIEVACKQSNIDIYGCFHPTPQKCKILKPSFLQT